LTDQANIKAHTEDDASLLFQDYCRRYPSGAAGSQYRHGAKRLAGWSLGKQRAAYGKQQLSKQLTLEFGKGYFLCGTTTAHPHRESGCYVQVGTDE